MLSVIVSVISFAPKISPNVVKSYPGITKPVGFWDPWNLSNDVSEGRFKFYREAELKHGRIAMLAALGFPIAEQFHPLWGGNIDVPSYVAFQQTPLQTFWPLVILAIGVIELNTIKNYKDIFNKGEPWALEDTYVPGDLSFDPLGIKPSDETELESLKNKEINNGRLAMGAIVVMVLQELITGNKLF